MSELCTVLLARGSGRRTSLATESADCRQRYSHRTDAQRAAAIGGWFSGTRRAAAYNFYGSDAESAPRTLQSAAAFALLVSH